MTGTVTTSTSNALATHGWWLASRASGLLALALVTLSVGMGLVMGGKLTRTPRVKKTLVALHEQTALAAIIAIAVHGVTLLGDAWLNPGVAGILIPFKMGFRPLFTGLGIIGGYIAALLGLSFYFRRRIGARFWRKAHRFTVLVYLLGVIHTLGAGTDATTPWLRAWLLATGPVIAALFVIRVYKARARGQRRQPHPAPAERHTLPEIPHRTPLMEEA